jgi:hypothetical protein
MHRKALPAGRTGVRRSSAAIAFVRRVRSAGRRRAAFHRRALVQSRAVRSRADARHAARLNRHAELLPSVGAEDEAVLAELETHGVSTRPIEVPDDVLDAAYRLAGTLKATTTREPCVKASPRQLGEELELFTWGLSDRLLDLAEAYIGLPPRYLGVEVKRELTVTARGDRHHTVRSWHLDHEDRRILKILVYLSDVDVDAGPFGYLDRRHTTRVRALSRRHHHAISDERMAEVVPEEQWNRVTGPRFTAVYADTGQVFHRVFTPASAERYSMTFAYSSQHPYYTYERLMIPRQPLRRLAPRLTPRQRGALALPM